MPYLLLEGLGMLDVAAFDFLCMDWVYKVLEKKGLDSKVIKRLKNLYSDSLTIVMVNNVPGKTFTNVRQSLRQGDLPSMHFFSFGIDPLLVYLEKRIQGILIRSLPVLGPFQSDQLSPLQPFETMYKVQGYLDDCKPT